MRAVACATAPPTDIVFVLGDTSSVINATGYYDNWYCSVLGFAQRFSNQFVVSSAGVHFGLVKYSSDATVGFYLNQYTTNADVDAAIRGQLFEGGDRDVAAGLRLTRCVEI